MKSKSNVRKLQRNNKGQWTITVPAVLAAALELEVGERMEWVVTVDGLILRRMP